MKSYLMPDGSKMHGVPDNIPYEQAVQKWRSRQAEIPTEQEKGGVGDAITQAASSVVQGAGHAVDLVPNFPRNVKNLGSVLTGLTAHGVASGAKSIGLDTISRGAESVANTADQSIVEPYSPVSRVLNAVPDKFGYELKQPNTPLEKQIDFIGQGIGGMSVMPLTPAMTIGRQLLIGGGAGSVAGNVTEATDSPALGALAGLAAGGAGAGISAARSTASLAKNNLRSPLLNGQRGAELEEGDLLRQYSDKVPVQTAVDALEASVKAPKVDPNSRNVNPTELKGLQKSKPTTGQVLARDVGDTRVLALEKPVSENFNTRQLFDELVQNNRDARAEQLRLIAGRDEGAGDLQVQLNAVKAKQEAIAEAERLRAANTQAQAVGDTGAPTSKLQAGGTIENIYDDITSQYKKEAGVNYAIDPFKEINNLSVPKNKIEQIIDENYAGVTKAATAPVRSSLDIVEQIAKPTVEGSPLAPKKPVAQSVEFGQVNPQLDDIIAAVRKYGGVSRADAIKHGVDPSLFRNGSLFPKEGGKSFDQMAESLSQDGYPVFEGSDYTANAFNDAFHEGLNGKKVYTPKGHEYQAALEDYHRGKELKFDDDMKPLSNDDFSMSYNQMKVASSRIGDLAHDAAISGDNLAAKTLTEIKVALRGAMDDAVEKGRITPDTADMYTSANKHYREFKKNMTEGAVGKLEVRGGQRKVKTENVMPTLLQGGRQAFDSFQRAVGKEPLAAKTAQDYLANDWRESVMTASGEFKSTWKENSNQWLNRNSDVLSNFPELKTKLQYAIAKSEKADALAVRLDKEMKSLEKGGASHFLKEKDPDKAFTSFIKSSNRTKDMDFISRMIKRDPEFKKAFRGALHEHLLSLKNDNQLAQFIESPKNQVMINRLLGKDILDQYKKVAADARRDLLRDKVTSARGSQTAPNEVANAALRTVNNLPMGIGFLSRVVGSKVKANSENLRSEVRQKSFLEPAYAAKLLKMSDEKPNYRGALTDSAKLLKEDAKRAVVGTSSETESKRKAMAKALLMKKGS